MPRSAPQSRPATRAATAGMAAHVFFELGAGVGMPLASVLGPVPAGLLLGAGAGAAWRSAGRRPESADPVFAVVNGGALAAVVAHLTSWPHRHTRVGLPWLEDCEGLGPGPMPLYNSILYATGAAAVVGLLRENRSAPAYLPLFALACAPLLAAGQHAEFRRLVHRARARPAWWNRRLATR